MPCAAWPLTNSYYLFWIKVGSAELPPADDFDDIESSGGESDAPMEETESLADSGSDDEDDAVDRADVELPHDQEENNLAHAALRANEAGQ